VAEKDALIDARIAGPVLIHPLAAVGPGIPGAGELHGSSVDRQFAAGGWT